MLSKRIDYVDYNGVERTETFYFNLSKAELTELSAGSRWLPDMIKKIMDAKDTKAIMDTVKELILMSYGEKSDDGRKFLKSEEISNGFASTEAYSNLFLELLTDDEKMSEFILGIVPNDMASKLKSSDAFNDIKNGTIDFDALEERVTAESEASE